MARTTNPRELAQQLWHAEQAGTAMPPLRSMAANLSPNDAYAIRREVDQLRMAQGAMPVGRKIGLSSRMMMERARVTEPFWAYIFDNGQIPVGAAMSVQGHINPRIETEIAVVLGSDLNGPALTVDDVRDAIASVRPAFEIIDMRTTVEGLDAIEAIADSGWNAGFVLGDPIPAAGIDLDAITTRVHSELSGAVDAVGEASSLIGGGPVACLHRVAQQLVAEGVPLQAGEIILTGTLLPLVTLVAGDRVTAEFSGMGGSVATVAVSAY